MKESVFTMLGICSADDEVVKAVIGWIQASDLCAQASDEDFTKLWRVSMEAQDRLHRYFTDESVTSIISNKDEIRQIIKNFGAI